MVLFSIDDGSLKTDVLDESSPPDLESFLLTEAFLIHLQSPKTIEDLVVNSHQVNLNPNLPSSTRKMRDE